MAAGSYDRFLNLQIGLIIGMQLLMCLFCSIASLIWREKSGKERYYLGMTEYVEVSATLNATVTLATWQHSDLCYLSALGSRLSHSALERQTHV